MPGHALPAARRLARSHGDGRAALLLLHVPSRMRWCSHATDPPRRLMPAVCNPPCLLAGNRFSLEQVKEAVAVATSSARGGKALLEG